MLMSTVRTLARGSSFGANEARDADLCCLVGEIVNITTILPQRHPLIVVPPVVTITHPMRIANEEGTNFMVYTEVDHLACGLVSLITDTTFSTSALLIFCGLQVLPTS